MTPIIWNTKNFSELNTNEIYEVYLIRQKVFVVEQSCAYQDTDIKDKDSIHLLGYIGSDLIAYLRIVPPGFSYNEVSIGRVLISINYRRKGIGKKLMIKGINEVVRIYGEKNIRISAQTYLIPFYESFGFKKVSNIYLEDDIPHIEMLLTF